MYLICYSLYFDPIQKDQYFSPTNKMECIPSAHIIDNLQIILCIKMIDGSGLSYVIHSTLHLTHIPKMQLV